jgi:hypothetical protein
MEIHYLLSIPLDKVRRIPFALGIHIAHYNRNATRPALLELNGVQCLIVKGRSLGIHERRQTWGRQGRWNRLHGFDGILQLVHLKATNGEKLVLFARFGKTKVARKF